MDDPPGNVDSGPPTGWVRLQLEPVDVPLEVDESLLLSTVQSAIPGAHGLYYNENGQKKALRPPDIEKQSKRRHYKLPSIFMKLRSAWFT
ncbi:unnamed protein product [Toxocara canis]|uniref:TDP43_N domain-containing protein n=1 Tax=Toxocara canis TaxID=6265 RepID=A0A183VCB6_TOXCA|nr:unnamed protein product [Toxocara canis]